MKLFPKIQGLFLKTRSFVLIPVLFFLFPGPSYCQSYDTITIDTAVTYQTITGFGGSLAYYEGWVTAHPNKSMIYDALFGELGLDILRLRNAHDYDPGMIDRAVEFVQAAESVRGKPIAVLSTSWGPPASLKSNNNRSNGGTIKYAVTGGKVEFDYAGFAHWWNASLDEYNAHGIFPDYISIQNEPDWTASYESCRLNPSETVNFTDTIAGYNKALSAVYDTIQTRTVIPELIGPETIGIGYNVVENYCNAMDLSKIHAIAHHLYHGVDENNPFASTDFSKVGNYHSELPHFQSEYSRGDWWSVAGMMYMSLAVENAAAYLYWDLAWDGSGLISLDFPWDRSQWTHPYGFTRTKEFFAFKQYSAFIHPGWKRIAASITGENSVVAAFISRDEDSAAVLVINRSLSDNLICKPEIPGYSIDRADLYVTSGTENCEYKGDKKDKMTDISPKAIATFSISLSKEIPDNIPVDSVILHPVSDTIETRLDSVQIEAEVFPAGATDKALFWQVIQNDQIAGITQDGLLIAKGSADGMVTLRAMATDGSGKYADTTITVINQVLVESISVAASAMIIQERLGSIQFTATVLPEEAYHKDLIWEIMDDSGIATINQEGLLQASGTGDGDVTVRVSATDGSGIYKELSVQITNQVPVTEIELSAADTVIDSLMGSLQVEAVVLPENASSKKVVWSVSEGLTLAIIDSYGLLTAAGGENGQVTVRATSESDPEIFGELTVTLLNQVSSAGKNHRDDVKIWYSNGRLYYSMIPEDKERRIFVYTMEGKLLSTGEIPALESHGEMDISMVQKGMYLVIAGSSGHYYYAKITVY